MYRRDSKNAMKQLYWHRMERKIWSSNITYVILLAIFPFYLIWKAAGRQPRASIALMFLPVLAHSFV